MFRYSFLSSVLGMVFVGVFFTPAFAQSPYPQKYFTSPLDIPLYLSGTFGELRTDHFHSGIDIRTGEVEGLKVFAVAEGYISRIKVSAGGYGKALYITHPNGYVSVYAHLQKFEEEIGTYVFSEQYRRESFEVDLYPETGKIKVEKGEMIALSGDSGGSGGPHLHFEIREAGTEKPINPLLFGLKVADVTPPVINLIKAYPADKNCLIKGKNREIELAVSGSNGKYFLSGKDTVDISGRAFFSLNTIDLFNNGNNKNGVYSIRIEMDSVVVFEQAMETFSYDETRYINSLIDYPDLVLKNRRMQKSCVQPNNRLSIYRNVKDKGIITFSDDKIHQLTYLVSDAAGNKSSISWWVKSKSPEKLTLDSEVQQQYAGTLFTYKTDNLFESDHIRLEVPGNALYDTTYFKYKLYPGIKNSFSALHQLHSPEVPLHTWCNLHIRADSIPAGLKGKALIVKTNDQQEKKSVGGIWAEGFVSTQIKEFGKYCVMVDTTTPKIIPENISANKNMSNEHSIRIKITDDLAGINTYTGRLNGEWILMDYDAKNDLLTYLFDDRLKKGTNTFELTVTDNKNNISNLKIKLIY